MVENSCLQSIGGCLHQDGVAVVVVVFGRIIHSIWQWPLRLACKQHQHHVWLQKKIANIPIEKTNHEIIETTTTTIKFALIRIVCMCGNHRRKQILRAASDLPFDRCCCCNCCCCCCGCANIDRRPRCGTNVSLSLTCRRPRIGMNGSFRYRSAGIGFERCSRTGGSLLLSLRRRPRIGMNGSSHAFWSNFLPRIGTNGSFHSFNLRPCIAMKASFIALLSKRRPRIGTNGSFIKSEPESKAIARWSNTSDGENDGKQKKNAKFRAKSWRGKEEMEKDERKKKQSFDMSLMCLDMFTDINKHGQNLDLNRLWWIWSVQTNNMIYHSMTTKYL